MKSKKNNSLDKKRLKIINFSKDLIIKNGWNKNLFNIISVEKKINSSELYILFPNGYKDMLLISLKNLNSEFEKNFNTSKFIKLPLHKRIKKIVMAKISFINLEKEFYKKIFYYLLLPNNHSLLSTQIYKSADSIWYIAMDQSTDFNYYTKRIILSGIYSSTLFHFFNNSNLDATEEKLDSLLAKVSRIPNIKKSINSLGKSISYFFKFFNKYSY